MLALQVADLEELEELREAAGKLKALCRASTLAMWKEWRAGIEAQYAAKLQVCSQVCSAHAVLSTSW